MVSLPLPLPPPRRRGASPLVQREAVEVNPMVCWDGCKRRFAVCRTGKKQRNGEEGDKVSDGETIAAIVLIVVFAGRSHVPCHVIDSMSFPYFARR